MKLFRNWPYRLTTCMFAVSVATISLWARAKHVKHEPVKAEVCKSMTLGRYDQYADVKATAVLLSLMSKHPKASTYEVTWDMGAMYPASVFYSAPAHILEFDNGEDRTTPTFSSDTPAATVQAKMSRQDLEVIVAQKVRRVYWNDWMEKRQVAAMNPAQLRSWKTQQSRERQSWKRIQTTNEIEFSRRLERRCTFCLDVQEDENLVFRSDGTV
ncbi:hypothetical protein IAD21_03588 [Abditibacteriota bacterium]|nr:hypothetical protein IAD21_03588 [Abditibacteriota bacterium]